MPSKCLMLTVALVAAAAAAAGQDAPAPETAVVAVQVEPAASPATETTLDDLLWIARPVVVFADTPNDPRYLQQMRMLDERGTELEDRRVVVLVDTDPDAMGPLRQELRPRGFTLVLIDTDGSVVRRHPSPTSAREIINQIDRLPSRRQETGSRRE